MVINTISESIISNTCNRRGNVYEGERTAFIKSTISNTCNRRGNVYGSESAASSESIISNTCNRRGNVYGGERTAILESTAFYSRDKIPTHIFLYFCSRTILVSETYYNCFLFLFVYLIFDAVLHDFSCPRRQGAQHTHHHQKAMANQCVRFE